MFRGYETVFFKGLGRNQHKGLYRRLTGGVLLLAGIATGLAATAGHPGTRVPSVSESHRLIVIDSAVDNPAPLINTALSGDSRIIRLKPGDRPLERIGAALSEYRPVESLHIVSHGRPGALVLAGQTIDVENLDARQTLLGEWAGGFTPGADILLYGCNIAHGESGSRFVRTLAARTDTDVAASTNQTGHRSRGADWTLENRTGDIRAAVFASADAQRAWRGSLQAGFTVTESGGGTAVNESGTTDTLAVVLDAQPATDVVLDISSADTGEATVSPASLTFTNGNWDTAQTVTVTGADDALTDGTQNTVVTVSVNDTSSDDNYDPLADQTVTVDTLDNESNISPTNNLPFSQSVNEDSFIVLDSGNGNRLSVIDNSGENLVVTLSVANGTVTLAQTTGLTFSSGDGTADAGMTFSGVVGDINAALDGLRYDPAADFNGSETLTLSSSDQTRLSYDTDANLQGHYQFNSGDAAGDSSPNNAPDGTLLDNAVFTTDTTRGGVLGLDGVDDGFEVPTLFGQPDTFTLAAWVDVTGVDTNAADIINIGDNILIRADTSTTNNWGDGVSATIYTAPSTWSIWNSGQYIEDTGWHYVAFSYDGGTGMGRLYLDGTEVVAMSSATPDWSLIGSTTRIGKHGASETTADFGGQTDDARIYNRALSGTEIGELYAGPVHTTDTDTLTITVVPVNDPPGGDVTIDNTTPQVTDTLTASNTLTDADGLSGPISYQWRRDGADISGATGSTYTVVSADIGTAISVVASYTDDDGTPESVASADTAAVTSSGDFTITESGGATSVGESGTTDTFDVVLDVAPTNDVVITIGSNDIGEATVSPTSLTFTAGNWDTAQTVTVTGVDDAIIDGPQNSTITLSIDDAASDDNYDPVADKTVTASTADNDAAGFTVSESSGSTAVDESGTTDTFTVTLTAQPASDVVIDISSNDIGEATVSPASLTFTSSNWNTPQTVTVTGVDDSLIDGTQNTNITLSIDDANSDNNFDPLADQTVTASTADDDNAGFTVTESGGATSVDESGTTDTLTVVLDAQPASDVVIDISSGDPGEATVSPASLTFTTANWNTAQTVTVTGVDDALVDGNQNTTITLSVNDTNSDDNFDPLADQTVTASTIDDDAAGFTVTESGGSTSVNESGTTDTFTVVLNAQPASDVVITVVSGDTGEASAGPASLTFTNGNWNVAQTVTVTGVDDALIDGTQNTTVTLAVDDAASDDSFDPLADQTVTAATADDDTASFTVVESGGNTAVSESGTTDTFTVVLDAQPASDVVIDISSGDTGEATVSPASLTFTSGNWNSAQTVTVTGVDDALIDGSQNTSLTVSVNDAGSDDNFDPLADQTVTATTGDDDSAGFSVSESGGATSVSESGTTDTFTVVLNAQPNSDVVIDLNSGDTGEATISPASLTFTSGNWNSAQTVTVTGIDDSAIDGTQNTTLTVSINDAASDNNFDPLPDQTVTASTIDDDAAGFTVTESGGSTSVNESGTTDTFTVVLNAQPGSDVVIDISSGDTGEATVTPTSLTFTSGNWNSPQTVTVTGVDDSLIDGTQNTTITASVNDGASDNNFDPLPDQTVTASTIDDDAAGFTVTESGGSTSVNESGTTDTLTVVLNAQPGSDVVIDIGSGDTGEATVSPASLTFTNGNWNSAQTVTITGVDDSLIDGTQNTTITASVNDAASDNNFDPLPDQTVTAATADDDSAGFSVTESGGNTSINESGTTDTFTVVLDAQPDSDVVIDIGSADTGEATVSPASLTFTGGNWNNPQTVTVTGVDDSLIDGTQNTTITVSVNDGVSDNNFDPLADQTVTASTTDDDAAGFTVTESGGSTSINETGTTDTLTVVLDAQPGSDVVIDVSSGDTGEATVSPASLTFTTSNWNSAQTVTITGVDDSLTDGTQTTTITLSVNDAASDDNYDALADQSVNTDTTDDDTAGFTVTESGGDTTVNESGTNDTFTVVLNSQPGGDVVIDVVSSDTGEATVSPASLTFTNSNWNSAQTVTVTGVDDAVADGAQSPAVTLSINDAASDDTFDPLADQTVTVTVADNETSLDDDNDGIVNVIEGSADSDGDGTPDRLDIDSDNDGIPDRIEADNIPPLSGSDSDTDGIDDTVDVDNTGGNDADFDGVDDAYAPVDTDGDGTPDYLDRDSDGDGLPDGLEADNLPAPAGNDADNDGIDDALDPDLTGGTDADDNGLDDAFEPRDTDGDGTADYRDIDSDNDGIPDGVEADAAGADSDLDGIDDAYDADRTGGADADGDGVDDGGATDTDGDGRPDYRELDSDNDTVPDVNEAGLPDADGDGFADGGASTAAPADSDGDGTADYRDLDSNNDAVFDIVDAGQMSFDSDGDGQIDPAQFVDPDNDGVTDGVDPAPTAFGLTGNGDSDGDGVPDDLDADDDNDGVPDAVESPGGVDVDSDGDGVVDRLDLDSDNDGIPDSMEVFDPSDIDTDGDGRADDTTDADNNGLADSIATSIIPADTDGDGTPDYLDADSDNDGISDLRETYPADTALLDADEDGMLDAAADADGDGLADAVDPDTADNPPIVLTDTDNDGTPNFRDLDSDNDGFDDTTENGDFNENNTSDHAENGDGITTAISGGGGGSAGLLVLGLLLLFPFYKRK